MARLRSLLPGRIIATWPLQAQIVFLVASVVIFSLSLLALSSITMISNTIERWNAEEVMDLARVVAEMPQIHEGFRQPNPAAAIQPVAERTRELTGVQFVVILDMNGFRLSHPRSELVGGHFTGGDELPALWGEAYTSKAVGISGPSLRAFQPIHDGSGKQIGVAVAGMWRNSIADSIQNVRLPVYVATVVSLLVGVIGAVILAQNVKRTIFGLEPKEIATLLKEREAMLQSVREGIIAINAKRELTLINEAAQRMLDITGDVVGRPVSEAIPNSRLPRVLESGVAEYDQEQFIRDTLVLTNRVPILVGGEAVGAVATFRDKTSRLAEELTGVRTFVEGLRAQTHEFMNRLHTTSGLLRLGQHRAASTFISDMVRSQQTLIAFVTRRVKDPATAGLLIGKISEAMERDVQITIDPKTNLGPLPEHFDGGALTMVLGNLISNAVDEVQKLDQSRHHVFVSVRDKGPRIVLAVSDRGRSIPPAIRRRIFERGFSTKPNNNDGRAGLWFRGTTLEAVRHGPGRVGQRTGPYA